LRFGWEPITESVSLKGGSPDRYLLEPVTGAAIVFDQGWVLVDTGFNIDTIHDDEQRRDHYVIPCYTALVPRGDPLVDQLRTLGLGWDDLAACVVSHLHCDHSGGLRHLVDGPPVLIQGAELDFAMSTATLQDAYFRSDFDLPGLDWELVEGDEELADGLQLLPTRGHTPGHTSVVVELQDSGTTVLACDAADLRANIEKRIPPGTTTSLGWRLLPRIPSTVFTTSTLRRGRRFGPATTPHSGTRGSCFLVPTHRSLGGSMAVPGLRGVHHVGITVPDIEEATDFFVEVLGCQLVHSLAPMMADDDFMAIQLDVHPRAVLSAIRLLRCGSGSNLELFEFESPDQRTETIGNADIGSAHLAFQVEDMASALEYLDARGVEILGDPQFVTEGPSTGVTWIYVRAPWGLQLELISYPEPMAYEADADVVLWSPSKPAG